MRNYTSFTEVEQVDSARYLVFTAGRCYVVFKSVTLGWGIADYNGNFLGHHETKTAALAAVT